MKKLKNQGENLEKFKEDLVRLRNLSCSEKMGNLRSSPVNCFLYSDTEVYTVGN